MTQARRRMWIGLIGLFIVLPVIGLLGIAIGYVGNIYAQALAVLPDDPQATLYLEPIIGTTQIYDSSGQQLLFAVQDPLGNERVWVSLNELPETIAQAILLWEEDPDFLETTHFDPFQTLERLFRNLQEGPLDEDHSLTGRLVRDVLAPAPDYVTVANRALEIVLVAEINRRYTPEEILEWHLNTNYYGNDAYGIEAAARVYLGKSARDLTVDELALLVAIPTNPQYNPADNEAAARGRQSELLRRMLAAGYITQSAFEQAIATNTVLRSDAGQSPRIAPEFALYARRQAARILGTNGPQLVARGGLRITTTLDLDIYLQAECVLRAHLARLAGDTTPVVDLNGNPCFGAAYLPALDITAMANPPDRGVIVILEATTNEILAMIGSGTQTAYPPGVTLYPFVYLNGLLYRDYTLATMLLDIRRPFPGAADGLLYMPNNPDGQFRGPISLRDALGAGLLPPAAQVANTLNLNDVLEETIHPMGINSLGLDEGIYDLSLLERGSAVSVLDVTFAYSVFAALGQVTGLPVDTYGPGYRNRDPVAIQRIEDANGNVLWDYNTEQVALSRSPLLQAEAAYLINDALADYAPKQLLLGENNVLALSRRAAVMNGMAGNQTDSWTVGYTPQIVVGVHLGRADGGELSLPGWGIDGAAPVWRAVMEYVHMRDNLPALDWPRPESIVETAICQISGLSSNEACPTRNEIFFHAGQFPPTDTYWQVVEINTQTNQLATASTPAALRSRRAYFIPPEEAMEWWRANNLPLPPTQYDTLSRPDIVSNTVILQPTNLEIVGRIVTISGSITADDLAYYQLSYGAGPNPAEWIAITEQQTTYSPGVPLGQWDTSTLDGHYTLQLTVVMTDETRQPAFSQVIVDNIPPAVILTVEETGRTYTWPNDSMIPLTATVTDNIRIDRVDFYYNGQYVGTDEEAPYDYEHRITRAGVEVFKAVVYDAVGNFSEAELPIEILASGN